MIMSDMWIDAAAALDALPDGILNWSQSIQWIDVEAEVGFSLRVSESISGFTYIRFSLQNLSAFSNDIDNNADPAKAPKTIFYIHIRRWKWDIFSMIIW